MKRAHPTAEALFSLIVEAYETLMDEEKKKEYLDRLKRGVTAKEEAEMAEKALKAEIEFQKGMVFFRKRQWREASHSFSQAMESNPGEPEFKIYFFWSRFMSLVNSPEEAKKVLLELENLANQLAPPFPRSFYFLGRGYKIVGDFARAHSYLKKARELLPEDLEVRQELRAIERELTDKKPPPSGKIT
jgi:tetratricopeptide (TPR) repeat protein